MGRIWKWAITCAEGIWYSAGIHACFPSTVDVQIHSVSMQLYELSFLIMQPVSSHLAIFRGFCFQLFLVKPQKINASEYMPYFRWICFFFCLGIKETVSPSLNPPKKQDDLELPEYMAPELGWLGVELAEALPEEFVLVRGVGTGQLVAVWWQRQKLRNESWASWGVGQLGWASWGLGQLCWLLLFGTQIVPMSWNPGRRWCQIPGDPVWFGIRSSG